MSMVPVIPDVSQVGKEAIVKKVLQEFLHVYYDFIIKENRLVKYQNSFKSSLKLDFREVFFKTFDLKIPPKIIKTKTLLCLLQKGSISSF